MVYESIDHGNDVTFYEKLRRKLKISVIVKKKSTTIFDGLHSYRRDNDAIKCLKLCSEITRLRLVVPPEL